VGATPSKLYYVLENGRGLLTHPSLGTGLPPTISNNENSKIALNFSILVMVTLEPRGIITCHKAGMRIWAQVLGDGTPISLEGKKCPKFGAISDYFRL